MFLEELVRRTRERVARRNAPPPRDLLRALDGPGISLIAEVKRRSPSRGPLRPDASAVYLAEAYAAAGASAISVLTEPDFFGGSLEDLEAIRPALDARGLAIPLLCKDFILDPYQVWEARAHGADAVLLIVSILSDRELSYLYALCGDLGMVPLVEVHDALELPRALALSPRVVGINNRDLRTLLVDLRTFERLRPSLPEDLFVVAESGVHSAADVRLLASWGARAVLVGEALMQAPDPALAVRELLMEVYR
jgi:indole-3-glycerol phosphate synthase